MINKEMLNSFPSFWNGLVAPPSVNKAVTTLISHTVIEEVLNILTLYFVKPNVFPSHKNL